MDTYKPKINPNITQNDVDGSRETEGRSTGDEDSGKK